MNVGVLGAGRIGTIVVPTIQKTEGLCCLGVASRSAERAAEYAKTFGIPKSYGNYQEMMEDPEIDLIYIATPHSHHFEQMMACLEHGKPVLCEKSFTANAAQAQKVLEYAKERQVYTAEAIWTRYQPSRKIIQDMIESGIVGKIHALNATLSYAISDKERMVRRDLCGGALLDVGVYGLNFALMHFGNDIEKVESSVLMTEDGVDGHENITLFFSGGRMASIQAGMYCRSDRQGIFYGEKGYITVENINKPQKVTAYDDNDRLLKQVVVPEQITGYEYEFLEAKQRIQEGQWESASMPLQETVFVMKLMDEIRSQWGLRYPADEE